MNKPMRALIIAALAATSTLSGCGGSTPSASIRAAQVEPADAPADSVSSDDPAVQRIALDVMWDGLSSGDRRQMCEGWVTPGLQEMLLDSFLSKGTSFDREMVRDFFDKKC
jgi:hypothetical protein